ncbi:MAG: polysulfide reductase NrfD [Magnetococcales bacterium]|nr:polysulfide reductase NrfD [Magnetococcales bacterium]
MRVLLGMGWSGGWRYRIWLLFLAMLAIPGVSGWVEQQTEGLSVTGMSDAVSWGWYIGQFVFFVGIAASAIILVVPALVWAGQEWRTVALIGEAMAVCAVCASLLFILVDVGRPERFWHGLPFVGTPHFPSSILSWDLLVLLVYLFLNAGLGYWHLRHRLQTRIHPESHRLLPWILVAVLAGIGIHVVTAFLLAGNPSRPFWNTALLAPRFIVTALAAGSGWMILTLVILRHVAGLVVADPVWTLLARVMASVLLINLIFLASEFFVAFHRPSGHSLFMQSLWSGQGDTPFHGLWMKGAWALQVCATVGSLWALWRGVTHGWLVCAALLTVAGIWMEKGVGLIVGGFLPTPLGEWASYHPTWIEYRVTLAIMAMVLFLFSLLVRIILAVEARTR